MNGINNMWPVLKKIKKIVCTAVCTAVHTAVLFISSAAQGVYRSDLPVLVQVTISIRNNLVKHDHHLGTPSCKQQVAGSYTST